MANVAVFLLAVLALAGSFSNVHAVDTEAELNEMIADTKNLTAIADSITLVDALFLAANLQGKFSTIVAGLEDITGTGNNATSDLKDLEDLFAPGNDTFSDCVQIANAFNGFRDAQETLLNALIDNAGVINDVPVIGTPVYNALGDEKKMIDQLAPLIVRACNGTKYLDEQVEGDQAGLDTLIDTTRSQYDPQGALDNFGGRKLLR